MKIAGLTLIALALVAMTSGCKKKNSSTRPALLTLTGKAEVPAPFAVYEIFDSAQAYAPNSRYSCPKDGNASLLSGPVIVLQTMKNCSDQQWLYFYQDKAVDLSAYAQGSIEVRLQASGGTMTLSAKLQDDDTKVSTSVDLSTVGFSPSKTGVEQKILIPVKSFDTSTFDLSKLKRLLHLDVSCASTNCYLSIFSLRWIGPRTAPTSLAEFTGTQHCDPFACHALKRATYRIYQPTATGWTATPTTVGMTGDDGTYSLLLSRSALEDLMAGGKPLLFALAEAGAVFTFSAILSVEDVAADNISLDTTLSSTLASRMICPGGRFPPPNGAYCYEPTNDQRDSLEDAISTYLIAHPLSDPDLSALAETAVGDASVEASLQAIVTDETVKPTAETITAGETARPMPPPTDAGGSSSTLPDNLTAGTYLLTYQVCAAGTCQSGSQTVEATSDTATSVSRQIASVFRQTSSECGSSGVTCQDRYSSFNGSSFTASRFMTACSGDVCTTGSIVIKMTLQ